MLKIVIDYIIRFLVGEHLPDEVSRFVGYASVETALSGYKVLIVKSDFFDDDVYGTGRSTPSLPLQTIEGVPFLFGSPDVVRIGETIVVHADLIASAYFLMSRYEEMQRRDKRDPYGRFPGRESLPYRAGFIDRAVIDEYGKLIRKWLNTSGVKIAEPAPSIRKINLTHDVDAPFSCRSWRNVTRNILSGGNPLRAVRSKYKPLDDDPYYTFPWMLQQDKMLQSMANENRCQSFLFFKAGGKTKIDKPHYDLFGKDIGTLFALCREQNALVGLHSSFQAGMEPSLIASEKGRLALAYNADIQHNRHHFLSSREPEDMEYLEKAGITDDYTMGYADVAGFRLGTSLPVRYINCVTRRLTSLMLHPLIIMDGTLSDPRYMNLTAEKAKVYCKRLIQHVWQANGELTLLWHNTTAIEQKGYHRELYSKLIKHIINIL